MTFEHKQLWQPPAVNSRVFQIDLHFPDFTIISKKLWIGIKNNVVTFFLKILISYALPPLYRFNFLLILAFGHNFWTIGDRNFYLVSMDC